MAIRRRYRPTLDECEEAIDFLADEYNYDLEDQHRARALRVRVHDYPEGSGNYFLILTWFGSDKPGAGEIPTPPGWSVDDEWFSTVIVHKGVNMKVWHRWDSSSKGNRMKKAKVSRRKDVLKGPPPTPIEKKILERLTRIRKMREEQGS